jgi:hypothetical protein
MSVSILDHTPPLQQQQQCTLRLQYGVGLGAYLWPQAPLPVRLALGPLHKFSGKLVWAAGLASMAVRRCLYQQLLHDLTSIHMFADHLSIRRSWYEVPCVWAAWVCACKQVTAVARTFEALSGTSPATPSPTRRRGCKRRSHLCRWASR